MALWLLADPKAPGRAQMICHAGRDLCTGLHDLRTLTRKERADTTSILREVDSVWQKEGLDAVGLAESAAPAPAAEETASPEATIPRYLMTLLQ